MSLLAQATGAIEALASALVLVFTGMLVLGFLALAVWVKDVIFYIVAGLVTCFIALLWVADYPALTVPVLGLGLYQLLTAVILAASGKPARGLSQLKWVVKAVKGVFKL